LDRTQNLLGKKIQIWNCPDIEKEKGGEKMNEENEKFEALKVNKKAYQRSKALRKHLKDLGMKIQE
jgi:hypothetical protein